MSKARSLVSLLLLIASVVTLAHRSLSQSNRSSISGFVFDDTRRPVPQMIVELRNEFSTIGRVKTDGAGRYYFHGLQQGRYSVRVLPLGTAYREISEDIEIAGIGVRGQPLAENVQRDIYLRPRKSATSEPATASVVFAQEVPKIAEGHYKLAVSDINGHRTQAGVENLEKAIGVFPDYFAALYLLGTVRMSQQRFNDATTSFSKALSINDRCFECWFRLSYSQYTVQRFADSTVSGEKAVFFRPDSLEANLLLGMAYRSVKNFEKAEASLKRAWNVSDGSSADVHWHLALLYGKDLNRFAEAAKELEHYLEVAGDIPNEEAVRKLIKHFKTKAVEQQSSR